MEQPYGFMAKGGAIKNQYEGREAEDIWNNLTRVQRNHFLVDHEDDLKLKEDGMSTKDYFETRDALARLKFSELKKNIQDEFAVHTFMGQYADGGFMEHGGDVDKGGMIYALREFVSSGEIANKTDVLNYDDIAKIRRIAIQYYMDNGDEPYSYGELAKVLSYANDKFKSGMMAEGGMTEHNLMIGDTIKQSFGNVVVVENDGKTYVVNINTGQRWSDSEWWNLSKGDTTKYTKMAKGGVFYSDSHKLGHE